MSQKNIERARAGLEALNRRDIDALLELLHPEIELMPSLVGGIEQTVFRGREGYRHWFEATWETYDDVSFEPHSFRSVGDQVVVVYTTRVRAKQSGIELEALGAGVLTFRDGLLVRQIGYQHPEEALKAVGLTE